MVAGLVMRHAARWGQGALGTFCRLGEPVGRGQAIVGARLLRAIRGGTCRQGGRAGKGHGVGKGTFGAEPGTVCCGDWSLSVELARTACARTPLQGPLGVVCWCVTDWQGWCCMLVRGGAVGGAHGEGGIGGHVLVLRQVYGGGACGKPPGRVELSALSFVASWDMPSAYGACRLGR